MTDGSQCEQHTSLQNDTPPYDWVVMPTLGDKPDAPCLRATTPASQNSAVGGDLGRFTQGQRLLDRDKYWVTVYDSRQQPA
ncbi:hypothetical protein ABZW18_25280 [Streptomyces sp. NPDC004647]|uniref:hypothetical protein n=1 Tax=Streptomyces sp. NPDC004647 TaxID=3154671 RepID=UPI0033BB92C1